MTIERLDNRLQDMRFLDNTPPPTTSWARSSGSTSSTGGPSPAKGTSETEGTSETDSTGSTTSSPGAEASGATASGGGAILAKIFGWFTSSLESVFHAVVDVVWGAITSLVDGLSGLSKVPEQAVGLVMLTGAKAISTLQTWLGLESRGRRLTDEEAKLLRAVYGKSVDLGAIRIKEGFAGVFSLSSRPFTLGNVIYLKDTGASTPENLRALLVHEAVHVWQFQHSGASYMPRSVVAQLTQGLEAAYDCFEAIDAGRSWSELSPEQQGQFLEEAAKSGFFSTGEDDRNRQFLRPSNVQKDGLEDYAPYLRAALAEIRGTP